MKQLPVLFAALSLLSGFGADQPDRAVTLLRLPSGGIQPQVGIDASATVHVVYFAGDPANGDLFYATISESSSFSLPTRVNSQPGSAIATGSVRGAQLAIGRNGRVHVAWNGSARATPRAAGGATPMLYARLDRETRAFEPQRNLLQFATGLDGGGAIAADQAGRVLVAWHAGGPDARNEGDRRVWLASSTDDGATFSRERAISDVATGACGCCGMDGLIDRNGRIFFLYRSARDVVHRDAYVLMSTDGGQRFGSAKLEEWNIGACPMSTFALGVGPGFAQASAGGPDAVLAAWETDGQVQFTRVGVSAQGAPLPVRAPGSMRTRRHPSLATNAQGDVLLAWTEGNAWAKGGAVAWQVFDRSGHPTAESGRADGVPVWGLVAAYARPDGRFAIVY